MSSAVTREWCPEAITTGSSTVDVAWFEPAALVTLERVSLVDAGLAFSRQAPDPGPAVVIRGG